MTDGQYYTNGPDGGLGAHQERNRDFVSALQGAVRESPVSAALISMGVLWLFMGGSKTSLFGDKSIFGKAASYWEQPNGAVSDVSPSGRRVAGSGADAASQIGGVVREASTAVGDAASRTGAQAADSLSSAYQAATHLASQSTGAVANATSTAGRALHEKGAALGTAVQQNLSDLFERQPLMLGAVGLAIGAGIAASIRATEAEKRTFGKASDLVRDTVTEKAGELKEMADAALKEADAQGLTPKAAGEALRVAGDKSAQVVMGSQSNQKRGGPVSKPASGSGSAR
jgi:hypothetical protein